MQRWILLLSLSGIARAEPARPMVGKLVHHMAAEGEDLVSIAARYRLAVDHLASANGFPITVVDVEPGTPVWIPGCRILPANPPRNGIVINLPERLLFLFRGGKFDSYFPLSIGDESAQGGRFQTPTGNFRIVEKIQNPTWYPPAWAPDRRPVPPGPQNPLGERWVGLSLPRTGIHGTNDPLNIGNSVTHGCLRMYPQLLREFYSKVEVGFSARIEYETCKLGRDGHGNLFAVTFPDVYKKSPPARTIQSLIAQSRLHPARRNFSEVMSLNLGTPVAIQGRETVESEWLRLSSQQK